MEVTVRTVTSLPLGLLALAIRTITKQHVFLNNTQNPNMNNGHTSGLKGRVELLLRPQGLQDCKGCKDAILTIQDAILGRKDAILARKDGILASQDGILARCHPG